MNNVFSEENVDQNDDVIDEQLNESNLMDFDASGDQNSSYDEYDEGEDSQAYIPYGGEFGNINPEEFDLLAEFTDDEEFEERQRKIAKASSSGSRKRKASKATNNNEISDGSDEGSERSEERRVGEEGRSRWRPEQ